MPLKISPPRIVSPLHFGRMESLAAVVLAFSLFLLAGCSGGDSGSNALAPTQNDPPTVDISNPGEFPVTYEAEDAGLNGLVIEDQSPGFSGSGYVGQFDEVGDAIEFSISVPNQDFYTLRFRFLNAKQTPAIRGLLLDGVEVPGRTSFKPVYEQTTPDGEGAWASVDESLRLAAGEHTIRLVFTNESRVGDVLIDSMQVLDETSPSTTSTRSLLMNNWTDLIGIHYSSKLNPGYAYAPDQGPRLASLHWAGNWSRSQIDSAAAFFRDQTSGTPYTNINQFESNLYFTDDGILNVDYLNYGDEILPVAIRKQYAMVPNEPFLIARYTLTNRSSESRDFSLMELVDLSTPGGGATLQADWYPELNAWIADTGDGAFLLFGAFAAPESHASESPAGTDAGLIAEFGDQGRLENTESFSGEDAAMAMTYLVSLGSGEEQERAFFYSVQPSRQEAEAVAGRIRDAGGAEPWFAQTRTAWQEWLDSGLSRVDSGDPGVDAAYTRNLVVIRQCQQPEFGSFVASTNPIYYHKVWPRDGSVSAMSLDAAGYYDQAEKFWMWMAEVQEEGPGDIEGKTFVENFPNGTWYTNYSFWALDEPIDFVQPEWDAVGQFLIGVYHHWRLLDNENPERAGQFLEAIYPAVVDSAEWISDNVNPAAQGEFGFGPPGYSVWEEDFEYATYTQVTYASGLNGARLLAEERGETERAQKWLNDARTIRDNLLDPVDSEPCGGMWDPEEGYFIRGIFAPAGTDSGQCEPDRRVDASSRPALGLRTSGCGRPQGPVPPAESPGRAHAALSHSRDPRGRPGAGNARGMAFRAGHLALRRGRLLLLLRFQPRWEIRV